jgi:hypothetical protein
MPDNQTPTTWWSGFISVANSLVTSQQGILERIQDWRQLAGLTVLTAELVCVLAIFRGVEVQLAVSGAILIAIVGLILAFIIGRQEQERQLKEMANQRALEEKKLDMAAPPPDRTAIGLGGLTFEDAANTIAMAYSQAIDLSALPRETLNMPMRNQDFEFTDALEGLAGLAFVASSPVRPYDVAQVGPTFVLSPREVQNGQ